VNVAGVGVIVPPPPLSLSQAAVCGRAAVVTKTALVIASIASRSVLVSLVVSIEFFILMVTGEGVTGLEPITNVPLRGIFEF